jgi:carbamoyltransferase
VRVLGLSFSGHGSSIALVEDGRVVAAMNLERLTRTKFALVTLPGYEKRLAGVVQRVFCLDEPPTYANFYEVFPLLLASVTGECDLRNAGIDLVVKTHDDVRPMRNQAAPYEEFVSYFDGVETLFDLEHHLCHAYQAFICSPFDEAAILTIDGRGENLDRLDGLAISTSMAVGTANQVSVLAETLWPSSVGAMYTNITRHLGFREEQEGNTMALAAFGSDRHYDELRSASLTLLPGGGFDLREDYLSRIARICPRRRRGDELTQQHYDIAWACQALSEDVIVHVARGLQERTGKRQLAMAGGVSLNCVANSKILAETDFEELYVMPNAGDRGLALGAALYGYHVALGGTERHPLRHDYLGPPMFDSDARAALERASHTEFRKSNDIERECAELVANGSIIGWVQGGAEFGPRALGHRSIIADPRTTRSKERLDADIKRREWFRPYAPSVLAEHADEYFEMPGPSPYMLLAPQTRPLGRERAPGIVHADGTARVQTVDRAVEPRYHALISNFHAITGVPLVMNTSFNGYGEPMVETPDDAVRSMHAMGLDALAVGDYLAWPEGSPVAQLMPDAP